MLAVIGIALFGMLSNGLTIAEMIHRQTPQIDSNLFVDRLGVELKNSVPYHGIAFIGTRSQVSFPAVVPVDSQEHGFVRGIGRIEYVYDKQAKTVERSAVDYRGLFSKKDAAGRVVLEGIESFSLEYYFCDEKTSLFFWGEQWPPAEFTPQNREYPLALRVTMVTTVGNTVEERSRTLDIPAGGYLHQ